MRRNSCRRIGDAMLHEMRHPGIAKAQRARLRSPRGGGGLTRLAEEAIFHKLEHLTEGEVRGDRYFGSTMLSISLATLSSMLIGPQDEQEMVRLLEGSVRVRLRAMRLAWQDAAQRIDGREFGTGQFDTRIYLASGFLHVDVDVTMPLVAVATGTI